MQQFITYILQQADLLIFLSAVSLITLSSLLRAVSEPTREKLHLKWLAPGIFFVGFSRLILAFSQISDSKALCALQDLLFIVALTLFFEFTRQHVQDYFARRISILIHLPILFLWAATAHLPFFSRIITYSGSILIFTLCIFVLIAARKLQKPGRTYAMICAFFSVLLTAANFFSQTFIAIGSTEFNRIKPPALFLVEAIVLFAICFIIVTGKFSADKRMQRDNVIARMTYSPFVFVFTIIIFCFLTVEIHRYMGFQARQQTQTNLDNSAEALSQGIHQQAVFANTSAKIIANMPILSQYLEFPDSENTALLHGFLKSFDQDNPDVICYIIDKTGIVKASSSLQELFVGNDLSMRPYYQKALKGESSNLIDFGLFTQQLGYYSGVPVHTADNEIIGVCAVKRNLSELDLHLKLYHPAMVVDNENKIFLSSDKENLGKRLILPSKISETINKYEAESAFTFSTNDFAFVTRPMGMSDWKLLVLENVKAVKSSRLWLYTTIMLILFLLTTMFHGMLLANESKISFKMAQEQFRIVFYNAPESILIISCRTLKILEANNSMLRQFSLENAASKSYLELIPRGGFLIRNVWQNTQQKIFKHEREFIKPCGQVFTAEVTGSQIMFNKEKAMIMLLHDISYHKQIESKLMKAKIAAEDANMMKTRFFANASHEIRTPLTAIIGLTELARSHCTSEEQKRILDLVKNSEISMVSLVNDILDLTRLESGQFSLSNRPFCLPTLVNEIVQLTEAKITSKAVKLMAEFPENFHNYINSDPERLKQVLLNLLDNSIKFTQSGTIKANFNFIEKNRQTTLYITVSDSGTGIPEEIQEVMFEPFLSCDPMHRKSQSGAGLGLAITRQIVEAMNGTISCNSNESGTTFTLGIPVSKCESHETSKAAQKQDIPDHLTRNGRPLRFLVADDNDVNLFLARTIIEKYNGKCDCAKDGLEALEMLEKSEYDALLIDIQMPRLDGIETIRMIRHRNNTFANVPIVSISAFASEEEIQKARSAGTDYYLVKPYFPDDLLLILKQALNIETSTKMTNIEARQEQQSDAVEKSIATKNLSAQLKQINLKELQTRILNKPENIVQINEIFSRRSEALLKDLDECLTSEDCNKLRETSHSIKGLTGMLAAVKPHQLAKEIEELSRSNQFSQAAQRVAQLKIYMSEISEDMQMLSSSAENKTL